MIGPSSTRAATGKFPFSLWAAGAAVHAGGHGKRVGDRMRIRLHDATAGMAPCAHLRPNVRDSTQSQQFAARVEGGAGC
jgi:hypothetical protein